MIFLKKPRIAKSDFYLIKSAIDLKRNWKIGQRFQIYNNELIDSIVEEPGKKINHLNVYPVVYYLSSTFVSNDYRRVLRNDEIDADLNVKIEVDQKRKKYTARYCDLILSRIDTNVKYVKQIMQTQVIDKAKYNVLKQDNPKTFNRMELLNVAAQTGINTDLLNQTLNYRNLDNLALNLAKQSQMVSSYEEALLVNETAEAKGLDPPITQKKWIWSELDNTRHSNMDGETIHLEDYFNVFNEQSGGVDKMLYPCDPEGSDGNIINCQCDIEYFGE